MPFFETAMTVLSATSGIAGLHSWFTGLKTGDQITRILHEVELTNKRVEHLSEHILYTSSIREVRDVTRNRQQQLEDGRQIRELLDPMQQGIGEDILSTAILSTPTKLQDVFKSNPWDVLIEVTPIHRARRPTNPALVPILFADGSTQYVGWQTQGVLPILFNCEYDPSSNLGVSVDVSLSSFINSIGMEFVLVSAGEFLMGAPKEQLDAIAGDNKDYRAWIENETPQHQVTISQPFYMGKYEVTQAQWQMVMGHNPSGFKAGWRAIIGHGNSNQPVEMVSWDDVQSFIHKLNEREGVTHYRLPTEAEWEYAARAGTTTIYSFGDDPAQLKDYAWYRENSGGETHPVGEKKPNPWGLYDMHGNVWEWVQDWYGTYAAEPVTDTIGPAAGAVRVIRGGSWSLTTQYARSAHLDRVHPGNRNVFLGFRCLNSGVSQ